MSDFYVYAYIDPRNDTPFYIGKGHGNRDRDHLYSSNLQRHQFFYNKLRKLFKEGVQPNIHRVCEYLSEEDAFYWETFFISALGRRNLGTGCLCNLTDGGEGFSGYVVTDKRRQQAANAARRTKNHTGYKHSQETRKVISKKLCDVRTGWRLSEKTKQKIGNAHRGRVHTDAAKSRMSEGQQKRFATQRVSEETRQKMSDTHTGMKRSDETRARMMFGKWKSHWLKSGGIIGLTVTRCHDGRD